MELVAQNNLFAFFFDRVRAARATHHTEVAEETEFYLVNLLTDFIRTRRLVESGGRRVDDQPLAIRLLESRAEARPDHRWRELKHLADSTLYVLGFFRDSLRGSTVDLKYYRGLGETAYDDLARLAGRRTGEARDGVFGELADKFGDCVELLAEVRDEGARSDTDIVNLYDDWLAFGGERSRRRLGELGMLSITDPPGGSGGQGH